MFFLLAVCATLGYALNNTLMAAYYRTMDRWWAVTLRGVGLAITMLPLLLVPTGKQIGAIVGEWELLIVASVLAVVGNWCAATAMQYLPVGIASAWNSSLTVLATAGFGYQFLHEKLSLLELLWMALLLIGISALGATKAPAVPGGRYDVRKGVSASLGFAAALGLAYTLIGVLSRRVHPLVAGYCWETTIALLGLIVIAVRRLGRGPGGAAIPGRDVRAILLYSIPAAVGTGCYAAAVATGPVAIVSAVLASAMIATSLGARLLYRERLTRIQWGLIVVVACLVIGLKLSSG